MKLYDLIDNAIYYGFELADIWRDEAPSENEEKELIHFVFELRTLKEKLESAEVKDFDLVEICK